MAKKGFYNIQNISKYDGASFKLRFLSSWELNYMVFCDYNPDVIKWSYERKMVRYYDPITKKVRRYKIDFYVKHKKKDGGVFKMLVEIKPKKQMFPPNKQKRFNSPKGFMKDLLVYNLNKAKWLSANTYAINNGMYFYLVDYSDNRFYYYTLKEVGIIEK
jgi:hypothetical protein